MFSRYSRHPDDHLTLCFVLFFIVSFITWISSYPELPPGETGSYIVASIQGSQIKPPGQPLWIIINHILSNILRIIHIPITEIYYYLNLFSCLCNGISSVFLFSSINLWTGECWLGLLLSGIYSFSPIIWKTGIKTEPRSFYYMLINILLYSLIYHRSSQPNKNQNKILLLITIILSLTISMDILSIVFSFPLLFCYYTLPKNIEQEEEEKTTKRKEKKLKFPYLVFLFTIIGIYLILPVYLNIKSLFYKNGFPFGSWCDIDTLKQIVSRIFTLYLPIELKNQFNYSSFLSFSLFNKIFSNQFYFGFYSLIILSIISFIFIYITKPKLLNLDFSIVLFGSMIFYILLIFHFYPFLNENNIKQINDFAYLIAPISTIFLFWFAIIIKLLSQHFFNPYRNRMIFISILIIFFVSLSQFSSIQERDNYLSVEFGKEILNSLPNDSILIINDDEIWSICLYLYFIENIRNDIQIINLNHLAQPWYNKKQASYYYPNIYFPYDGIYNRILNFDNDPVQFDMHTFLSNNFHLPIFNIGGWLSDDPSHKWNHIEIPYGYTHKLLQRYGFFVNACKFLFIFFFYF